MSRAGVLAIGGLIALGGLMQSGPRYCPLPVRALVAGLPQPAARPAPAVAPAPTPRHRVAAPSAEKSDRTPVTPEDVGRPR